MAKLRSLPRCRREIGYGLQYGKISPSMRAIFKTDCKRMMPEDSVYGEWPASGEIDLAESKGNSGDDYPTGRDSVGSALVCQLFFLLLKIIF